MIWCAKSHCKKKVFFFFENKLRVSLDLKIYEKLLNHLDYLINLMDEQLVLLQKMKQYIVIQDSKSILKTFTNFYSNLAGNLLAKLLKLPNRYRVNFVSDYCKNLALSKNFKLDSTIQGCLSYSKMSRPQKQQEMVKFQESF